MGGEMIYILHQRLKAQNVAGDKSTRILNDAIKTMFLPAFIEQLFEPQKIFSITYTKQIFHKIVHSSIMTLNETSMSKLFDLMLMGFKYQLIASNNPHSVYQVSMNHLEGMQKIIKTGIDPANAKLVEPALKLIEHVKKSLITKFSKFNNNDFMVMRKELLRYLQDKTIRVSVFLQDDIQNTEGRILVENKGYGNVGLVKPGMISYYNDDGKVVTTNAFTVDGGKDFIENKNHTFLESTPTELGQNIYEKERKKKMESTTLKKAESKAEFTKMDSGIVPKKDINSEQAKKELNLLATLLGGSGTVDKKESLNFNLFPDLNKTNTSGSTESDYADIIVIDTKQTQSTQMQNVMKSLEDKEKLKDEDEEEPDDLLSLMDQAN
jgi:hypothetical protein